MTRHEANTAVCPGSACARLVRRGLLGALALVALGLVAPACLDRPVAPQQPSTSKSSIQLYRSQKVDKIDLLFMIDNSASMADKQTILAQTVPDLVDRLTNPVCVNTQNGAIQKAGTDPANPCPQNFMREFEPVKDIHIGVITSSIGGHGGKACSPADGARFNPRQDDHGQLISRGPGGTSVDTGGLGFLAWTPANAATTIENFTKIVQGTGEDGCGYEASLEAWYRFLVDPVPYAEMVPVKCNDSDPGTSCKGPNGIDTTLLKQRHDFLRPDSLLSVIMLTDENDCSIVDGGQAFFTVDGVPNAPSVSSGKGGMFRGTAACETDPWSADCYPCYGVDPAAHPECADPWLDTLQDSTNLRCFEQKRRFGADYLYPIKRYVDALTQQKFGNELNPIFCTQFAQIPDPANPEQTIEDRTQCLTTLRDTSLVFIGGIVGVPWQDIARDPNDLKKGYRTAEELTWTKARYESAQQTPPPGVDTDVSLWNVILGKQVPATDLVHPLELDPTVDPIDPLMKESVEPRSGTNPATGKDLAPPDAHLGEAPNGAEWNITTRNDLQYACIFDLPQPINCESATGSCDCKDAKENPLCWDGSAYTKIQRRAKAYPGRRELAVLRGVNPDQAIVASICPANVGADNPASPSPDWGYRPAISAIVERLKSALQGACWGTPLEPDSQGQVACVVIEANKNGVDNGDGTVTCPPCEGVYSEVSEATMGVLEQDYYYKLNELNCACVINQVSPDNGALQACIEQETPASNIAGWCYVDPKADPNANKKLVATCPQGQDQMIRFVGQTSDGGSIPAAGSLTYLQCRGGSVGGGSSTTSPEAGTQDQ